MTENEILTQAVREFMKIVDNDCEKADKAVEGYDNFYEFVENNPQLKEYLYGFFYKLIDSYVTFKFYTYPIPALVNNKDYMDKYARDVLLQAQTFFNFGGFKGVSDENIH